MDSAKFESFLEDVFKRWPEVVKKGAGIYVFHSTSTHVSFEKALKISGFIVRFIFNLSRDKQGSTW